MVAGGVAGWLAQRAATVIVELDRGTGEPPDPPAARPVSKKSPSTLRHQLGLADRELADAIAARDLVQTQLSAAGADHARLGQLGAELGELQAHVDVTEERWLSLADEAESLGMDP